MILMQQKETKGGNSQLIGPLYMRVQANIYHSLKTFLKHKQCKV